MEKPKKYGEPLGPGCSTSLIERMHIGSWSWREVPMKARVLVAGHALHAQLIVFPLGLLGVSPVWDIVRLRTGEPMWGALAYWTIVAGVIGALLAAVPGFIDYLKIPPRTRARTVGTYHLVLNLIVVGLFALSLGLRAGGDARYSEAGWAAMLPGWLGVALAVVSGWLGGELVENHGIGVHEDAHPDAPSSLRPKRATPGREAGPLTAGRPSPART
jgi:uncharacterized membrane protein